MQPHVEGISPLPNPGTAATAHGHWSQAPSARELLLLVAMSGIVFVSVMLLFHSFLAKVVNSGDNPAFLGIASAIRHWDFRGLNVKAFWGLPYTMAAVSSLTRISDRNALLLISYVTGFSTIVLAGRLWGNWIAGFFAVLNFDWIQRLFLGGSEPLFMLLILGSFLFVRKQRWWLAAWLAAFATIVRPVGIFALLALGLTLLIRRNFRDFSVATLIGLIVGALYILPLVLYFQNPLANVRTYQQNDWAGGQLLTWPLGAILKSSSEPAPLTNLALTWGWILFVLAGFIVLLVSKDCRELWRTQPCEMMFAIGYLAFIFTYNSPHWLRGSFPRFAIPILPFILLAFYRWLPKDRRVVWGLVILSSGLAACSAIGIRNVAALLR